MNEDCVMWSMVGTKIYKKCAQVYKLEAKIKELEEVQWYLSPELDVKSSPYKGKGLTWIKYAQIEFKRAEAAQERIKQLETEIERFKELYRRWEHMIDPDTDPGGCANCFHQEFLKALKG